MTRVDYAKAHLPELESLLRQTIQAWEAGIPIKKACVPSDIREDLEPWWRRYCSEQYNKLIRHLGYKKAELSKGTAFLHKVADEIKVENEQIDREWGKKSVAKHYAEDQKKTRRQRAKVFVPK